MDSARFIRNRTLLIAWIATPLIMTALLDRGAHSYLCRQHLACVRNQTLAKVIPQMQHARNLFDSFIQPYRPENNPSISIHDQTLQQISKTARAIPLELSSVNLKQTPAPNSPGIVQINMQVKAMGTPREITEFLNRLKSDDPQIYESQVTIVRNHREDDRFQLEAELCKIYLQPKGQTP